MEKQELSFMENHVEKMSKIFKILLALFAVFELVLAIRGLIFFNLEKKKLRYYLYSYIFLFAISLVALVILLTCKDTKIINISIYVYSFLLIMWSAVITCIDCYANGDSGIIVYVMTCISVGVLTLIRPSVFLTYLGISGAFFLVMSAYARGWQLYSSGFYINFFVFIAVAIFINVHNYRLSKREYEATQQLKRLSYIDQLTGIFNRRRLDERLTTHIEAQDDFVFVLLDIDNLKQINDNFGHPVGDVCLVALAEKLTEYFGEHVYRFGGDEFSLIAECGAEEVCEKLDAVNKALEGTKEGFDLQISAGVYEVKRREVHTQIFAKADEALYKAKNSGKGKWVLYNESKEMEETVI